ncbi:substrate-binding domain-containing protein [Ramlibacter solisilvae]|nr:extracellular solute-binding protein [Ramlibacter tataouinensis]
MRLFPLALLLAATLPAHAASITMASTTSTDQSGLFGHLLPQFTQATGIEVRVLAVGTGEAIAIGHRGEADVLFVHDPAAEAKFVAEGGATKRNLVMYNDFVLVGPRSDPAGAKGADIVQALRKVAAANAPFVSRGDRSGTHAAELRYWAQLAPSRVKGGGYLECNCDMGKALSMANSSDAYVLADRGTWLSFGNRGKLAVLVEGDTRLFNQYGVMVVNPAKHPQVRAAEAQKFVDWVTSPAGQAAIAAYKIRGQQLFFPNAANGSRN